MKKTTQADKLILGESMLRAAKRRFVGNPSDDNIDLVFILDHEVRELRKKIDEAQHAMNDLMAMVL